MEMMKRRDYSLLEVGESAILIYFGNVIERDLNLYVINLDRWINKNRIDGIRETIPAYASLLVTFDPCKVAMPILVKWVEGVIQSCPTESDTFQKLIEIPVIYGGADGMDLEFIAKANRLTARDVVNIHSEGEYFVAMMGFTPGFVYLNGLNEKIFAPRLETPRAFVAPGSVGIAGSQTGIYSIGSPGGWRIIGRTSLPLFDSDRENPFLCQPGDRVRFYPEEIRL
jgi:KipI family sensor histidine kinase inhibitor